MTAEQGRLDWSERDPTANYHGGNPFSVAAHAAAKEGKDALRRAVYDLIAAASEGLTCDEVEVVLGRSHQSVSARITELKAQGRIVVAGRRPTRTGSPAAVYVAAGGAA